MHNRVAIMHRPNADGSSQERIVAPICNPDAATQMRARWLSVALSILLLSFFTLTVLLLPLRLVSYAKAKAFFDSYVVVHGAQGNVRNYLTEEAYNGFVGRLPIAACVFGICGVTLALFKRKLAGFLLEIPSEWKGIRNSLRRQFHGGAEIVLEIGGVFIVFGIGIFLRLRHLGRLVRFDEAWTYIGFASRPLVLGLSRYPAANNHLLNTLLIYFSTRLFGNTIFGLRFPALAVGCLVILAAWFVTRHLYDSAAGILAAGCVAALPTFIEFSINAAGYALQWLSILGLILFAEVLQENPSLRTAWLGLVVAAVVGIYSIPTTLVAVAGIFGWMLASTLADGKSAELSDLIKKLSLASVSIGLLSILLYVPPILVSGPPASGAQNVVSWQRQFDFLEGMEHLRQCAWLYWTEGVPRGVLWILFGGLLLGLLFHPKVSKQRVPITIVFCVVAVIFVLTFHVFGFPRVWSYLLLSAVMTSSAGLSLALRYLAGQSRIRLVALAGATSVALVVFVAIGLIKSGVLFTTDETVTIVDADEIVQFLSTELRPGDFLVSNNIIEYEILRRDPRLYRSLALSNPRGDVGNARVVAVVLKNTGSTELCGTSGLVARQTAQDTADPAILAGLIDLHAYAQPQIRAKFLTSTVYSLERKQSTTQ
jgi:Dolichyl-phosphate-mannose-protein mannosyltransferase